MKITNYSNNYSNNIRTEEACESLTNLFNTAVENVFSIIRKYGNQAYFPLYLSYDEGVNCTSRFKDVFTSFYENNASLYMDEDFSLYIKHSDLYVVKQPSFNITIDMYEAYRINESFLYYKNKIQNNPTYFNSLERRLELPFFNFLNAYVSNLYLLKEAYLVKLNTCFILENNTFTIEQAILSDMRLLYKNSLSNNWVYDVDTNFLQVKVISLFFPKSLDTYNYVDLMDNSISLDFSYNMNLIKYKNNTITDILV